MNQHSPIIPVQPRQPLLRRLKKTKLAQRLKATAFMQRGLALYLEARFHLTFKGFDHGKEFNGYICRLPFEYAELTSGGDISVCCYLPKNLGNVKRRPFRKVWNSYFARKLRGSMLDGSFRYCDKTLCRSMQSFDANLVKVADLEDARLKEITDGMQVSLEGNLKTLSLGNDYTCNLKCPSCRVGMRKMGGNEIKDQWDRYRDIMATVGPKLDLIHISGDGDAFSSIFYDQVIRRTEWERYPNLKIGFQTNGIALTEKKWNSLPAIVRSRVAYVGISIDGATAPTYERLRLGGKFARLMENITYLANMPDKKTYGFPLNLNMIVQAQNYHELVKLVELGKAYGVDSVSFTYLRDWGTFAPGEYARQAVHLPSHPEHHKLVELLADPSLHTPYVDLGNLAHLS